MPRFSPQSHAPQSHATVESLPSFFNRRKARPLLCILPLLAVPGLLSIVGGTGQMGQTLRIHASLLDARQDAPLPTAPLAERLAYTRGLYQEDLCTFQAKMDYWQAAAHTPGAAGRHARQKVAQWQRLYRQSRRTLERQARGEESTAF